MVAIAFFDLDRTLIAANSAVLWLKSELRLGHVSRLKALLGSVWVARYHLGFAGRGDGLRHAIATLAGTREADVRERTLAFYDAQVRGLFRPGARATLDEHRSKGDHLVLLTSSSLYMAELVKEELGLDAVLCNRLEVDPSGCYTGKPLGELCYGSGKLAHAETFAKEHGSSLQEASFYTDSFADIAVLLAVGRPVAVNPDVRLRRVALSRGWQIVDWGQPEPVTVVPPAH